VVKTAMRSPTLNELPPPLPGRTGWPWTEESESLPDKMPDGCHWPLVSIVTPSYNQGRFIEETIRSVLMQGYPDLEYIIMDGGSTDDSLHIIRKYEPWLAHWISKPDRGQAHAINKGFAIATGSLIGWINSDDQLLPGSLALLAEMHQRDPAAILAGDVEEFGQGENPATRGDTVRIVQQKGLEFRNFVEFWTKRMTWHQPGVFFPTALLRQVGFLDETLHYAFDHDFMCRLSMNAQVHSLDMPIARFRRHSESKTGLKGYLFLLEVSRVSQRYWNLLPEVDESGHDQFVSDLLFRRGIRRCQQGHMDGLRLMWQALRMDPPSALGSIPRRIAIRLKKERRKLA